MGVPIGNCRIVFASFPNSTHDSSAIAFLTCFNYYLAIITRQRWPPLLLSQRDCCSRRPENASAAGLNQIHKYIYYIYKYTNQNRQVFIATKSLLMNLSRSRNNPGQKLHVLQSLSSRYKHWNRWNNPNPRDRALWPFTSSRFKT